MDEEILGLKEHEEYVKKYPVPDGFTMEKYRGWRYFLKQDDGSYEVLRVIDIDKDNKSIVTIWNEETTWLHELFLWILPISAILAEFLQMALLIPGTGDWIDVIFYVMGILTFLIYKNLQL